MPVNSCPIFFFCGVTRTIEQPGWASHAQLFVAKNSSSIYYFFSYISVSFALDRYRLCYILFDQLYGRLNYREREGNSGSDALSIDTAALNYWRYVRPALIRLLLLIKQMGDALIWRLLPDTGPDFVCCTDDRLGDGHFFKQISICVLGRPNNSHLFGNITINKVNLHWWNLLWFLCYYYLNDTNGSFRNKVTTVAWWMVASLYLSHSRCCHLS